MLLPSSSDVVADLSVVIRGVGGGGRKGESQHQ